MLDLNTHHPGYRWVPSEVPVSVAGVNQSTILATESGALTYRGGFGGKS